MSVNRGGWHTKVPCGCPSDKPLEKYVNAFMQQVKAFINKRCSLWHTTCTRKQIFCNSKLNYIHVYLTLQLHLIYTFNLMSTVMIQITESMWHRHGDHRIAVVTPIYKCCEQWLVIIFFGKNILNPTSFTNVLYLLTAFTYIIIKKRA